MITQQVHRCEFCGDRFESRPQVKKPRACSKNSCQKKRQRSNELEWRKRNSIQSDPCYHKIRKQARMQKIREIAKELKQCFQTGARFIGKTWPDDLLEEHFFKFLIFLGIRKINKLWPA